MSSLIKEYWKKQALVHGQSQSASWSDHFVIDLEIKEINKNLPGLRNPFGVTLNALDIGCANGYSTIQYARKSPLNIKGIDYISEMITEARKRLEKFKELSGRVSFEEGDILSLKEKEDFYDIIICTRVIINLGTLENQIKALKSLSKPLKSGGILYLSEATVQGWNNLNSFRKEYGLSSIPVPHFNLYLNENTVVETLSKDFYLQGIVNFASSYYVGTRVFKPLLLKNKDYIKNPKTHLNRFMSLFPAIGDYGVQKLFIFRKK